jgi:uncharacterized membrane protein HdeD (DUF308 family)
MIIQALEKIKQQTIISSLLLMIVGLLMLIIPVQHDEVLVEILGYAILLLGGVLIWDFIYGNKKLSSWILFTAALLLVILGLYVLISGNDVLTALSVIFGILLMVDGLHSAVHAWMYARRSGKKWWWVLLLLSLSLILAGIVILNNPWWHTAHSFVKVIGGVMLYGAAVGIVRLILVWPIQKK